MRSEAIHRAITRAHVECWFTSRPPSRGSPAPGPGTTRRARDFVRGAGQARSSKHAPGVKTQAKGSSWWTSVRCSAHDADAHLGKKGSTCWVGSKVSLTETCEDDLPNDAELPVASRRDDGVERVGPTHPVGAGP